MRDERLLVASFKLINHQIPTIFIILVDTSQCYYSIIILYYVKSTLYSLLTPKTQHD